MLLATDFLDVAMASIYCMEQELSCHPPPFPSVPGFNEYVCMIDVRYSYVADDAPHSHVNICVVPDLAAYGQLVDRDVRQLHAFLLLHVHCL
jgi:hypothetical protein